MVPDQDIGLHPSAHRVHSVRVRIEVAGADPTDGFGFGNGMASKHSRRDFLRGELRDSRGSIMRPPGAQGDFERLCDDCGACSQACPQKIVRRADRGGPSLDFSHGACTFCGECARACPTGALVVEDVEDWPWRATILETCLSHQGISCRTCEDACEPRAIRFRLQTGGRALPVLDQNLCNGCGECAFTCPAQAVAFERRQPVNTEMTA